MFKFLICKCMYYNLAITREIIKSQISVNLSVLSEKFRGLAKFVTYKFLDMQNIIRCLKKLMQKLKIIHAVFGILNRHFRNDFRNE